jgi:hypothetical protein
VVGAFGERAAMLPSTGKWEVAQTDGAIEALAGAGFFGRVLSVAVSLSRLTTLDHECHVVRCGHELTMKDSVLALHRMEAANGARRKPTEGNLGRD